MGASYAWTNDDLDALVSHARARGLDPSAAALSLFFESAGFDPGAVNPGGAYGLNQLAAANLRAMGIDPKEYVTRSAAAQLPTVFAFWDGLVKEFALGKWPKDAAELEALNWLPAFYTSRALNGIAIATRGDRYYGSNEALDPDGTGTTTLASIRKALDNAKGNPRWPRLAADLDAAIARITKPDPKPAPPTPEPPIVLVPPVPTPAVSKAGGAGIAIALVAIVGLLAAKRHAIALLLIALLQRSCA